MLLLQQQKLLHQHQAAFSALVGAGAGVTPDAIAMNASGGRSSVPLRTETHSPPIASGSNPSLQKFGFQPVNALSPLSAESRLALKKRVLENASKDVEMVDVVTVSHESPQTSAKMPKMVRFFGKSK